MIMQLIEEDYSMYSPPGYSDEVIFPAVFSFYSKKRGNHDAYHFSVAKINNQFVFKTTANGVILDSMDKKDVEWIMYRLGLKNVIDNYSII